MFGLNKLLAVFLLAYLNKPVQSCLPNWSNQCQSYGDCCSNYCDKPSGWLFGVCKNKTSTSPMNGGVLIDAIRFRNSLKLIKSLVLNITDIVYLDSNSIEKPVKGCQSLWSNQCRYDSDCCSRFCEKPTHWTFGVCKGTDVLDPNSPDCQATGSNQCQSNNDCCSRFCDRPANWLYGLCKDFESTKNESMVPPPSQSDCQLNGSNRCKIDSDCCSNICDKSMDWLYGVCNGTVADSPVNSEVSIYPTRVEFKNALEKNGFPDVTDDVYLDFRPSGIFVDSILPGSAIDSKREMAMFLAQCIHESGGLQYRQEINPDSYPNTPGIGVPGIQYYGRGFIQLTWDYNYQACSQTLYEDSRLLEDPNLVSDSVSEAWITSFWFWAANVHGHTDTLDNTTSVINGAIDTGEQRAHRIQIYQNVLDAFSLPEE